MSGEPVERWLSADEAAELVGLGKPAFQRAVNRGNPELKKAQRKITKSFSLYDRDLVMAWAKTYKRRAKRS